ncbi:uncharacterized protein [Drosophila tropicalis]|uniref:uncharacterized protein n=1 Tax=Drosophila tropicalis TaxID=46794 RepID=UPI0035ABAC40
MELMELDDDEQQQELLVISPTSTNISNSNSFPLAQAQNDVNGDNDEINDDIAVLEEEEDEVEDLTELNNHHHHLHHHHHWGRSSRSSSSNATAADIEVDGLLMPELANATALDCDNFVDYDEFNLCLNNILSEEDDDDHVGGGNSSSVGVLIDGNSSSNGKSSLHHHHHQSHWRDAGDVLNIMQLNNELGLSFQEFANETTTSAADEQRSVSNSSPQLA